MANKEQSFLRNKETDIDHLLVTFNCWQKNFSSVTDENEVLREKVKCLEDQVSLYAENESRLEEEMASMKKVHEKFQKMLEMKCTIEHENWKLKDSVKSLQEEQATLRQEIVKQQDEWELREKARQREAQEALAEAVNDLNEQNERAREVLATKVKESEDGRQGLLHQVQRLEREKHAEVTQLRLKYDAKLQQLHKDTSKAQQHASKTALNSTAADIFRQKYMNAKQSSEREISSLKRTITDLQKKLEQRAAGTATSAKKRRFQLH